MSTPPDNNDPAMNKNKQQLTNGSNPTTTTLPTKTTTTTTTTALQQPQPLPGPSSGIVIQSTAILGSSAISALPATATPSISNMTNNAALMSNPIAIKQLIHTKFNAMKNYIAMYNAATGTTGGPRTTRSTTASTATPTPFCNDVSVPQGKVLVKPDVICPSPPDWRKDLSKAFGAGTTYIRTSVDPFSSEYAVISDLVSNLNFTQIERVINVGLWEKFTSARRDSLVDKSDDLDLFKGLGLNPTRAEIQSQTIKKFKLDPSMVDAREYSDNMALLFHGTKGNLEDVLVQGLDERLGSSEGLLGRGLYFADNPMKSIAYDIHGVLIIFAVYLGDCMGVDHLTSNKKTFVREPRKADKQKRTPTDLFFDSIVGRPNTLTLTNEYVLYNRFKCCPIYIVSYDKKNPHRGPSLDIDPYAQVRSKLPPFAWIPKQTDSVSSANDNGNAGEETEEWPFFAKVIFDLMRKKKDDEETDTVIKLSLILELGLSGFENDSVNLSLLRQFNFDLEKTIDYILNHQPTRMEIDDGIEIVYSSIKTNLPKDSDSNSNSPAKNSKSNFPAQPEMSASAKMKILLKFQKIEGEWMSVPLNGLNTNGLNPLPAQSPIRTPLKEDCLICCNEFPPTANHWVVLKCTHKLCTDCHRNIEKEGVTMGGVKHKSVKCPFCQCIEGIQIGTCPTGTMKAGMSPPNHHCEGYEDFGVILISYEVNEGKYQTKRHGFLPNSLEGVKVLKLLHTAWDRRLCFSIGTSVTTGQTDVLVWNIHHKTKLTGGSSAHGYPDPTYLARVTQELKQLGVE